MLLGRTASGLYWMYRYIERAENIARIVDAGLRMALTRTSDAPAEWSSVLVSSGTDDGYRQKYDAYAADTVTDYLLRDRDNPSSVLSCIEAARSNARMVRTALTRGRGVNGARAALRRAAGAGERTAGRARPGEARNRADPRQLLQHDAAQRDLRFRADRRVRRARRQHCADHRREIPPAAAVGVARRHDPRQLPVGDDPALRRRAPFVPLGVRRAVQADEHRRLPDPERPHAALAALLLRARRVEPEPAREGLRCDTPVSRHGHEDPANAVRHLGRADLQERPARVPDRLHRPQQQPRAEIAQAYNFD